MFLGNGDIHEAFIPKKALSTLLFNNNSNNSQHVRTFFILCIKCIWIAMN